MKTEKKIFAHRLARFRTPYALALAVNMVYGLLSAVYIRAEVYIFITRGRRTLKRN